MGKRQLSEYVPAVRRASKGGAAARAGYRKGEQTRERILDVALKAFGAGSFRAVTTRQISEAARVSLPTLQYYFGSKEGLYLACAEAIVERYRSNTLGAARIAADAVRDGCAAETAREHLKGVIGALGGFLVGSKETARWAHFVAREMRDPGPAFEILYASLWRPGIELTARLIARIRGGHESDPAIRVQALLLISGLMVFQSGRSISLRAMQWATIGPDERALVLSGLNAQIDAIGGAQPG
jgi:TetR/AcrR family transcriptional regulator, regulator of cefoperazone and chloramphenicol sensitivity